METIEPVALLHPQEDVWVYDMGQNFSGWCRLQLSGPQGAAIRLAHGAKLFDDGSLDARSNIHDLGCTHIARQVDTYILKGEGVEVWEPRFTLHGFATSKCGVFPECRRSKIWWGGWCARPWSAPAASPVPTR